MKFSELKKEAQVKLNGKLKKASSIYFIFWLFTIVLYILFFKITTKISPNISDEMLNILQNLLSIVSIPFSFGVLASMIELSRNKDINIFSFFKIGIQNFAKLFKMYIAMIIKLWKPLLLYIIAYILAMLSKNNYLVGNIPIFISLILFIISLAMLIVKSLAYSLAIYIFYDNPEDRPSDILDRSEKIMKGYKFKIVLLDLSFIGWILLILLLTILSVFLSLIPLFASINNILSLANTNIPTLVLLIGIVLLIPYMEFTKINFYEELISNEKIEN